MKVVTTEPSLKDATRSAVNKPATSKRASSSPSPSSSRKATSSASTRRENKYIERVKTK